MMEHGYKTYKVDPCHKISNTEHNHQNIQCGFVSRLSLISKRNLSIGRYNGDAYQPMVFIPIPNLYDSNHVNKFLMSNMAETTWLLVIDENC